MMTIRTYNSSDKKAVLELLSSNSPKYFAVSEQKDFENYLENEIEDYFVVEENATIVASGGVNYFPKEKIARISWDIVALESHGKGIGKKLLQHRINLLKSNTDVESIVVRTSQHAYLFYQKMGFEVKEVEKNFWAQGFDLYLMQRLNID